MRNITRSANDMIIDVHSLHKQYKVEEYYTEIKNIIVSKSKDTATYNKLKDILYSSDIKTGSELHRVIVNEVASFSPDDQLEIIDEIGAIQQKFKYDEYCKKVIGLKKEFMANREDYFWNKFVCTQIVDRAPSEITTDPKSFKDRILSVWIDLSLIKIKNDTIDITYEDMNGKIRTIKAKHHEPKLSPDYIESNLIDRYIGVGFLDSFYVHGLYDVITNTHVAVPISLIIDMYSDSIDEIKRPEPKDDGKS